MSTTMNFIIKKNNRYKVFDITSGGLHHLYDPKIFEGDDKAIKAFINQIHYFSLTNSKPTKELFTEYEYFIVMDFDKKEIIDYQPARYLQCLSPSFDYSWFFSREWKNSNQIIKGLVKPSTLEIIIPFPDDVGDVLNFLEENKRPPSVNEKGNLYWPVGHYQYHVAIVPHGWKFRTLDSELPYETLLMQVREYYKD